MSSLPGKLFRIPRQLSLLWHIVECLAWNYLHTPGFCLSPSDCGQLKHRDRYSNGLWFSHLRMTQFHLEGLLKHSPLDPTSSISNSVDLQWDLVICISNEYPGNPDAAGPGNTLRGTEAELLARLQLESQLCLSPHGFGYILCPLRATFSPLKGFTPFPTLGLK